jgi:hypothetical protein
MQLTSKAFDTGKEIPLKYSCDGADISPPLTIEDVPDGAQTLALICEDPDAPVGVFDHWIIFNIPPQAPQLAEGIPTEAEHSSGFRQGTNDFGRVGYGGPCPPDGEHRYFFRLYALDTELDLPAGSTSKKDLQAAMEGHILAETELMGTYKR